MGGENLIQTQEESYENIILKPEMTFLDSYKIQTLAAEDIEIGTEVSRVEGSEKLVKPREGAESCIGLLNSTIKMNSDTPVVSANVIRSGPVNKSDIVNPNDSAPSSQLGKTQIIVVED